MPRFEPFRATTYRHGTDLQAVSAPPYDVISEQQKQELAAHPHNFVRITLPGPSGYEQAALTMRTWLSEGILTTAGKEQIFLYRCEAVMDSTPVAISGFIGALGLERFGEQGIFPHENTNPGPKADRLELMKATHANLEPLWFFASRAIPGYGPIVEATASEEPTMSVVDGEGVKHSVWPVEPGDAEALRNAIRDVPLVVADGHHRYETSLAYADLMRQSSGPGPWDLTLALVMDPKVDPPPIMPIHRILEGASEERLIEQLGDVTSRVAGLDQLVEQISGLGPGHVGVATADRCVVVEVKARLDTEAVAAAAEASGATIRYEHSVSQISSAISQGAVAAIMAPVELDLVAGLALSGERMPPKTTLFWPKPRSGLLFRLLQADES